jgi:hypothetical protein
MKLEVVSRKKAKMKLALQGPSGSGKSLSALLVAYGLCGNWNKIAVIDSENGSANLYAHKGNYKSLRIDPPFTPEKYIQATKTCEQAGMEVIIIDSVSHEWEGNGGVLDMHSKMVGNSFTNWNKLTGRHNAFVQSMLQSNAHIIATIRAKQDYVLNEKNGKMVPEKVGLKGVQRDGLDFEFTIVFDLDIKHNAVASKDRTSLFMDKPDFIITEETGKIIKDWCNAGDSITENVMDDITNNIITEDELFDRIKTCKSSEDLLALYTEQPIYQETHLEHFTKRKQELTKPETFNNITPHLKAYTNGTVTTNK